VTRLDATGVSCPACLQLRSQEFPSLRRAVQLALDCARGVAYLHNHNPLSIIHRCVCGQLEKGTNDQKRLIKHGKMRARTDDKPCECVCVWV